MAVASARVDATLEGFTRWAREVPQKLSGDPDADAEELRLLLGLLRGTGLAMASTQAQLRERHRRGHHRGGLETRS